MFCKDKMVIKRLSDGKGLPLCSTGTAGLGGLGGQDGPRPTLSMVRNIIKMDFIKKEETLSFLAHHIQLHNSNETLNGMYDT